ncbi:MAG: peptidyl-prolyl cis-trans isomerase, partial [Clostridiales bacterium]|nr:peptidyl-prolyl cis-trans isomerase [Clostridiales bacterium]
VMTPLAGNVQRANDAFNDLIYLYNTDPGAFDNDKGYVVKYQVEEGEARTYMEEFEDAAREMRKTLEVGQVYAKPVITDYGVHIMYLSSVAQKGAVQLNDVTSPNGSQTYYDLLEEPIKTKRENSSYTDWSNNVFTYNYKKHSKTYTDNFKNLWED